MREEGNIHIFARYQDFHEKLWRQLEGSVGAEVWGLPPPETGLRGDARVVKLWSKYVVWKRIFSVKN